MIKEVFDIDYSKIYYLIIYLWIDIIHVNKEEELINVYNQIKKIYLIL